MSLPAPVPVEVPAPRALPENPRIEGINPALRAHVHRLVETYPQETVRVIREWMAETPAGAGYRH